MLIEVSRLRLLQEDQERCLKHRQVDRLNFDNMTLDEAALAELSRTRAIRELDTNHWTGGDAELLRLAKMPALQKLNLMSTKVTVEGTRKFQAARADVTTSGDFNLPATTQPEDKPK